MNLSSPSGCLATANLEFNLRRGRLLPERQMVKGWGKRCWEIHPLTSVVHSVCPLSSYMSVALWVKERKRKAEREYGGYVSVFTGRQLHPCALRAYFTTYLHILKPSCNIASHSSAVVCCRSHQFSASLSFMCNLFVWLTSSYSDHLGTATHVHVSLSVFCAIFL